MASYASALVREFSGLLFLYLVWWILKSTHHDFFIIRTAILIYVPIASIRLLSKYATMSLLEKRTLPPILKKGMCRAVCKRRTPGMEIRNICATSLMVSNSIGSRLFDSLSKNSTG
jgi:uncharacterized membrane protein YwzB